MHFKGQDITIPPPPATHTFAERQPSKDGPDISVDIEKFGPTERVPLGTIVHARSGDKGSDCNCGFWVRHADEYTWLRNLLTTDKIKQLLGKEYDTSRRPKIEVERFELYNMKGVHFLFVSPPRDPYTRPDTNHTPTAESTGPWCDQHEQRRLPRQELRRVSAKPSR